MLFVGDKTLLFGVIGIGTLAFLRLAVCALKMKVIMEFEYGISCNYLVKELANHVEEEFLFFSFRHLSINNVVFLFLCLAARKGNTEGTGEGFGFSNRPYTRYPVRRYPFSGGGEHKMSDLRKRNDISFWIAIVAGIVILVFGFWLVGHLRAGIDSRLGDALVKVGRNVTLVDDKSSSTGHPMSETDYREVGLASTGERTLALLFFEHYNKNGSPPLNLNVLLRNSQKNPSSSLLNDPWGSPYLLRLGEGGRFDIISGGPSGSVGLDGYSEQSLDRLSPNQVYVVGRWIVFVGKIPPQPMRE